jgi:hypothetical protein
LSFAGKWWHYAGGFFVVVKAARSFCVKVYSNLNIEKSPLSCVVLVPKEGSFLPRHFFFLGLPGKL